MTAPDVRRLGQFVGMLVIAAVAVSVAYRVTDVGFLALTSVYMFSPLVAGGVVCVANGIRFSEVGLRLGRPRWLALAALLSLPLVAVALLFSVLVPEVVFAPSVEPIPGLGLPTGVIGVVATLAVILALGATVNAIFAFGEEFGWRGYLLWELAPLGFWRASAAIGTIWGIWHAPAILEGYNYPSFPIVGVVAMVAVGVALSPVYTYLVIRAESVLAAALLHGVFNSSAGLVLAYAVTDDALIRELVASPIGLAGVVSFAIAAGLIALSGPPALEEAFPDRGPGTD